MDLLKMPSFASALAVLLLLGGCGGGSDDRTARAEEKTGGAQMEEAIFAGGCFWCMQAPFEKLKGVSSVVAGYTGGEGKDPTYEDYAEKGHVEAIDVTFDPAQITYSQLLDVFWRQIDPTDAGGQFVDRGPQYRSAIFYHNDEQKRLAEKSKQELAASGKFDKPIVDRNPQGLRLLQGRGLSPGLLQEEPDPVQVLSLQVRARRVPRQGLGQRPEREASRTRAPRDSPSPARKS